MNIIVRDNTTGVTYSNSMDINNKHTILSMSFCTSYTCVSVQDRVTKNGGTLYPEHDIILPPLDSKPNWVDMIACQNDHTGEWVTE